MPASPVTRPEAPVAAHSAAAAVALISAATDLFYKRGYDATSVREIVEAAGLTKGAFYHYFESKEELLRIIQEQYLDRQLAALIEIDASDATPTSKLEQVIHQIVEGLEYAQRTMAIQIRERRALSAQSFDAIKTKRDRYEEILVGVVSDGMKSGEFSRVGDPRVIAFGIIGMCSWGLEWYSKDGPEPASEIARWYAAVILTGLRAPGAP